MDLCTELGKLCMVKNPRSSLFWLVTPWAEQQHAYSLVYQDHQACYYGSSRPKWTRLAANFSQVQTVSGTCDGKHKHAAWGVVAKGAKRVYATALEVHYPTKLCEAIVDAFVLALSFKHCCVPEPSFAINAGAQVLTGIQRATSKLPPFVPEFAAKLLVLTDANNDVVWPQCNPLMKHHKLLYRFAVGSSDDCKEVLQNIHPACNSFGVDGSIITVDDLRGATDACFYGVPWEPEHFVKHAMTSAHPSAVEAVLPKALRECIQKRVHMSDKEIAITRHKFAAKWARRASELVQEEAKLKQSQDPGVAQTHPDLQRDVAVLRISRHGSSR